MRIPAALGLLALFLIQPAVGQELECQGDEALYVAFGNRVNQVLAAERAETLVKDVAAESTSSAAPGSAAIACNLRAYSLFAPQRTAEYACVAHRYVRPDLTHTCSSRYGAS